MHRDLIRFANDRLRVWTALAQPLLFLFVLAPGLQPLSRASTDGVDLATFLFPGVLCMAVWFSAMISAASFVMDREQGLLRGVQVAPVARSSILVGKCLSGTVIAAVQIVILLALAGLVGVPYEPVMLAALFGIALIVAFTVTALGVMVATSVTRAQTFNGVMQLLLFPTIFLSGAMFPTSELPDWLAALNRVNPLTYAVDILRRRVFAGIDTTATAEARLSPGVSWSGWTVPEALELGMITGLGVAMLAVAIARFSRLE